MISKELLHLTNAMHVLYVEDSVMMRHVTEKMLSPFFTHLDTAADGAEAFELYKKFHTLNNRNYDLVITDLEMPNVDGKALSEAVLSINSDQAIIVISSSNELSLLIDLLNIGVKKFLAKPIDSQQLHDVISDVAHDVHHKKLKEEDLAEIAQYNAVLKKREEVYLRKLEKNFKEISEFNDALNESSIVSKTDPQGIITYVNDKFCNVSGYSSDELIGHSHNIVNSGDNSSSFFEKLWRTISAKKSYTGVFKNRSKDAAIYYVESLIKPIVGVDGEITEFVAIAHDITRMIDSIEIAKQADIAKDDFFRNISHEMRTPLNSILGLTSLLKRRAKEDPKFLDMLTIIEQNSQQLSRLVESILDLQRINNGSLELNNKEYEPDLLYRGIIASYEAKIKEKNLIFDSRMDTDIPKTLFGDLTRIQQVIEIVLDNALKFTPSPGTIEMHLFYDQDEAKLMCQVQDSGIGIAPEDQEKIFKLSQIDGSVTRKHEGSGLGLTIANALILKMNGSFTVHSVPGKGSTFLMKF